MKVEIDDITIAEIVKHQLTEMYEHTQEDWYDWDDAEEMRAAIAVVLQAFMSPQEHSEWELEAETKRLRAKKHAIGESIKEDVIKLFDHLEKKRKADQQIGAWLSAALHDPSVCPSMKDDINEWFACTPQEENS